MILHSGRGSEYQSRRFRRACRRRGETQSMSRVGSCFDAVNYEHDHLANSALGLAAWKISTQRGD
ncbi:hypothetical protein ACIBL5_38785 [Streptomyces sp. NPDC050516]|uniref:hypothetical protein n=1 Tax=Streptomyces sp. NPDC050516 TaxID=3365621 RepID=UPI0037AE4F0F